MNTNEDCETAEDEVAPQRATLEEVKVAYEHLRKLVERCDSRVIIVAIIDLENKRNFQTQCSKTALSFDGSHPQQLAWIGAFGHFRRASSCFSLNAETISKGIEYMLVD